MKNRLSLLALMLFIYVFKSYSQDSIPVMITTDIFYGTNDEWIHLKISDTLSNTVVYDSLAAVTYLDGFKDTVYLDSGVYKCEIIDMGPNVSMPNIVLDNGDTAVWGYPAYEYYLFTLPSSNTANLNEILFLQSLKFYPNPTREFVTLEFNEGLSNGNIVITSISGKILHQDILGNEKKLNLDLSNYPNGVYFITINVGDETRTTKIIKSNVY